MQLVGRCSEISTTASKHLSCTPFLPSLICATISWKRLSASLQRMLIVKEAALTRQGKPETPENIFVNQKACDLQIKKLWESCYDSYRNNLWTPTFWHRLHRRSSWSRCKGLNQQGAGPSIARYEIGWGIWVCNSYDSCTFSRYFTGVFTSRSYLGIIMKYNMKWYVR